MQPHYSPRLNTHSGGSCRQSALARVWFSGHRACGRSEAGQGHRRATVAADRPRAHVACTDLQPVVGSPDLCARRLTVHGRVDTPSATSSGHRAARLGDPVRWRFGRAELPRACTSLLGGLVFSRPLAYEASLGDTRWTRALRQLRLNEAAVSCTSSSLANAYGGLEISN
jgi:hypothetical protein